MNKKVSTLRLFMLLAFLLMAFLDGPPIWNTEVTTIASTRTVHVGGARAYIIPDRFQNGLEDDRSIDKLKPHNLQQTNSAFEATVERRDKLLLRYVKLPADEAYPLLILCG